jgi:hypothetical protein
MMLHLLTPVAASLSVLGAQIYLGGGVRPMTILMVAALTLFIYSLNGVSDAVEDGVNDAGRAAMLRRSGWWTIGASGSRC